MKKDENYIKYYNLYQNKSTTYLRIPTKSLVSFNLENGDQFSYELLNENSIIVHFYKVKIERTGVKPDASP